MGTQSTLLCIHHDPGKLLHLEENGYRLLTATNASEGLRLLSVHQLLDTAQRRQIAMPI